MKILRISLRNLASLAGTHTVDFTREPLRSTGLFSISGPTGSGKSTLLDALCLALYEDTPRLAGAPTDKLPDAGGEITQKDPANLLRRGATEGFAEVAFVGVDGSTYTARWSIRRAHQRTDGALQKTEMALYGGDVVQGTGGVLVQGGKKSEVLPAIAEKVGLSFSQFTRAVLLAQNDFATFLKANDKDRALILQALTGSERFERWSIAVFSRDKVEREAVQAIENQRQGHAPLAPEPRAQAEAALAAAQSALQSAQAQVSKREEQVAWFVRQREFATAAERAAERLAAAARALADAAPRRAELDHAAEISRDARPLHEAEQQAAVQHAAATKSHAEALARKTQAEQRRAESGRIHADAKTALDTTQHALAEAGPALARARMLDAQIEPLVKRVNDARLDHESAETALKRVAGRADKLGADLKRQHEACARLDLARQPLAHLAPVATDAPAWIERLTSAHVARQKHERTLRELKSRSGTAADVAAQVDQARTHLDRFLHIRAQRDTERLAAAEALKAFDPDALASDRRALESTHAALVTIREQLGMIATLSAQANSLQVELAKLHTEVAEETKALAELRTNRVPSAHTAWAATQEARINAEAAVGKAAGVLRETLRPQQPCPVCGGLDHPFALHPPVVDAALEAVRAAEKEKHDALEALRSEITRRETALQLNARQIPGQSATLETLKTQLSRLREVAPSHPVAAELAGLPEAEGTTAVARRLADVDAAREALAARETKHRAATKADEAVRKLYNSAQSDVVTAEKRLADLVAKHAAAASSLTAAQENLGRAETELASASAALEPLFALLPGAVRAAFADDAVALIQAFSADSLSLRNVDQQLGEATQAAAKLGTEQEGVRREAISATELLAKYRAAENTVRQEHEKLRVERAGLLGGRPADMAEHALRAAMDQAIRARDLAATNLAATENTEAAAAEAVRAAESAVSAIGGQRTTASLAVDAWLAAFSSRTSRPFERATLVAILARDEAWFRSERAALDALTAAANTAEGERIVHAARLAAHVAAQPTLEVEAAVMADLAQRQAARTEAERRHVAAAAEIASDDRRRQASAELLQQLTAQQAKAAPWGKLNELIGSADGAKFRAIAQRRTLDVLLGFANAQLDLLSARYRLERLPESLNLIVLDRDMADERRSVHSLSGGESFLVSLALALGLASLTSNRIRIESLFIDEGFGSLDSETLNTAMSALMQLEAQGRKVGVISHVTEMADAIPVQIRVVKGRSGTSRLVVPGGDAGTPDVTAEAATPSPPPTPAAPSVSVAQLAERLLGLLQREKAAGVDFVSSTSLRKELGCEQKEFTAARMALDDRVVIQGRSFGLR